MGLGEVVLTEVKESSVHQNHCFPLQSVQLLCYFLHVLKIFFCCLNVTNLEEDAADAAEQLRLLLREVLDDGEVRVHGQHVVLHLQQAVRHRAGHAAQAGPPQLDGGLPVLLRDAARAAVLRQALLQMREDLR